MGAPKERELVNYLEKCGWGAVRIPGSGGATDRNLPDIIAGDGGDRYWGIEEKYSGAKKQVYVDEEKARGLREFCTRFGLTPLYAVRYSTNLDGVSTTDWFVAPVHVPPTKSDGDVKLHHSVVNEWPTLSELVRPAD